MCRLCMEKVPERAIPKFLSWVSLSDGVIGDFSGLHYIFKKFPELLQ